MPKSFLREPLVHFIGLAILLFAVYGWFSRGAEPSGRIVVSAAKIEQLSELFANIWQRPPTAQELKARIDDYVKEEIYVREALALKLDEDDTIIRRRLRQKMEFMAIAEADATIPTEAQLNDYLQTHPRLFSAPPKFAFEQIFLNPRSRGDKLEQDAETLLKRLRADPDPDTSALGDPTLLPAKFTLTSETAIDQSFGGSFAQALASAPVDRWSGPIASAFGLHLVRLEQREAARLPVLGEVRDAVLREWTNERRQQLEAARLADLLKRYEVTVEMPAASDRKK